MLTSQDYVPSPDIPFGIEAILTNRPLVESRAEEFEPWWKWRTAKDGAEYPYASSGNYDHNPPPNRLPRKVYTREYTSNSYHWRRLTRNYSSRRSFSSTKLSRARDKPKSTLPPLRSRTGKSVLGDPKAPVKAKTTKGAKVTSLAEQQDLLFSSFAQVILPEDSAPPTEVETSSNEAPDADTNKENKKGRKRAQEKGRGEAVAKSRAPVATATPNPATTAAPKSAPKAASKRATTAAPKSAIPEDLKPAIARPSKSAATAAPQPQIAVAHKPAPAKPTNVPPPATLDVLPSRSLPTLPLCHIPDTKEKPWDLNEHVSHIADRLWDTHFDHLSLSVSLFKCVHDAMCAQLDTIRQGQQRRLVNFMRNVYFATQDAERRIEKQRAVKVASRQVHSGLRGLSDSLDHLFYDFGRDSYAVYSRLLDENRTKSKHLSHYWRDILSTRMKLQGSLSWNPGAWVLEPLREFGNTMVAEYMASRTQVRASFRDILTSSDALNSGRLRILVNNLKSNYRSSYPLLGIQPTLHRIALRRFYLSKPRSDIYWKHLIHQIPFENHSISFKMAWSDIEDIGNFRLEAGKSRTGHVGQLVSKRLNVVGILFNRLGVAMGEIDVLRAQLTELSWIRLELEDSTFITPPQHPDQEKQLLTESKLVDNDRRFFLQWVESLHPVAAPQSADSLLVRNASSRSRRLDGGRQMAPRTKMFSKGRRFMKSLLPKATIKPRLRAAIREIPSLPRTTVFDRTSPSFHQRLLFQPDFPSQGLSSQSGFPQPFSQQPQYWSHTMCKGPGGKRVQLHHCKNLLGTETALKMFEQSETVGFDIEWESGASIADGIKRNVSLIQIANEERVALIHIASFHGETPKDLVSPTLKKILESPDITKVGVAIKADSTRLSKYLGIESRGLFELSHLYKLLKYSQVDPTKINKRLVNLSLQVHDHLGLPLRKDAHVRCGSWSKKLTYTQVQYAATDPYACLHLFDVMESKRKALKPIPPRPALLELNVPIRLAPAQTADGIHLPFIPEEVRAEEIDLRINLDESVPQKAKPDENDPEKSNLGEGNPEIIQQETDTEEPNPEETTPQEDTALNTRRRRRVKLGDQPRLSSLILPKKNSSDTTP